jgi:polysaccharide export outer membrane protein
VPAPAQKPAAPQKPAVASPDAVKGGVVPPAGYVIGPDDVLGIVFWREKELSQDVMVRPDGKISVPLLNDVDAAGLTPEQLRERVMAQAQRLVEDANVTVIVKQINSRRVYITGQVGRPGPYPLSGPTTVLQLIAIAGGVLEYADSEEIVVMRNENGVPSNYPFNYKEVIRQKNLKQNIELKPGDTVVVP